MVLLWRNERMLRSRVARCACVCSGVKFLWFSKYPLMKSDDRYTRDKLRRLHIHRSCRIARRLHSLEHGRETETRNIKRIFVFCFCFWDFACTIGWLNKCVPVSEILNTCKREIVSRSEPTNTKRVSGDGSGTERTKSAASQLSCVFRAEKYSFASAPAQNWGWRWEWSTPCSLPPLADEYARSCILLNYHVITLCQEEKWVLRWTQNKCFNRMMLMTVSRVTWQYSKRITIVRTFTHTHTRAAKTVAEMPTKWREESECREKNSLMCLCAS